MYENTDEAFHERQVSGAVSDKFSKSHHPAKVAMTRFAVGKATFFSEAQEVAYVDYSVSHLRTTGTGSMTENGEALAGSSIDLLLRDAAQHYLVVGEVKAQDDRLPFLGLIQSLAYAVELSTYCQQRRLEMAYAGTFKMNSATPSVGIGLFSLGLKPGSNASQSFELSKKLSEALIRDTDGWLRRITFYDAVLTDDGVSITSVLTATKPT